MYSYIRLLRFTSSNNENIFKNYIKGKFCVCHFPKNKGVFKEPSRIRKSRFNYDEFKKNTFYILSS